MLCLWLTHREARGGGRRATAWRPPPRVSLFFYLQVGHGGIPEGRRAEGGVGRLPGVPLRASPFFFISELDTEVSRRAGGRRRMRQGWGTGRLPSPSLSHASSAVCLLLKKMGLPDARNSSGAPKGDCGCPLAESEVFVPGQSTVAAPLRRLGAF